MKVRDVICFLFGIATGITMCLLIALYHEEEPLQQQSCDPMEHAKIKMALAECSDAVMVHIWGEDYKETVLEEK